MTWKEFFTTKFGLWIDTRSSTNKTLHGSSRTVEKGILLQIEKASESSGDLTCYVFSFEDAVAHLRVTKGPKENDILTIEKLLKAIKFVLYHSLIYFL